MPKRFLLALFALLLGGAVGNFSKVAVAIQSKSDVRSRPVEARLPDPLDASLDQTYATVDGRELHFDVFRRKDQTGARPALVLVHGGGWFHGTKDRFHALAHAFALRGYVTIAIEYRLGGDAPYPAAIVDCHRAFEYIAANAEQLQIDPANLFALGGSAGGHLVGMLASASKLEEFQPPRSEQDAPAWKLKAALVMAGPMDLTSGRIASRSRLHPDANTNRWLEGSIDEIPERYRQASPITHFSAETSPIFFFAGELDSVADNGPARKKLAELGVPTANYVYHQGQHGCWNEHPWFDMMINDMDDRLRSLVSEDALADSWPVQPWEEGSLQQSSNALEWKVPNLTSRKLRFPRLNNPVTSAKLVGVETGDVTLFPEVDAWQLNLPHDAPEESVTIRVETIGMPRLARLPVITCEHNGSITMPAHLANVHGELLRYEPQPHKNTVGYWANADDWCSWRFHVDEPGTFEIRIWQGCGKGQGGSQVKATIGEQSVAFEVVDTGHFQNFVERSLGKIKVDSTGTHDLELRVDAKAANAVMDVRQIQLVRISE